MKENVLDVLMYLFETYVDTDEEPEADQNELRDELSRAGFTDIEIDRALDWLDGLTDHQESIAFHAQTSHGLRVYNDFEQERLDAACRGYIAYLEQIGILSPQQREILIDRLLALESTDIDVDQIKWVVLMVLFSQPGQELAYARMEDLVFEESTGSIH
jgi:Smg protein